MKSLAERLKDLRECAVFDLSPNEHYAKALDEAILFISGRMARTPRGEEILQQLVGHRNDVYSVALEAAVVGEAEEFREISETASMLDEVIKWIAPDADIQKLTDEAFNADKEILRGLSDADTQEQ